MQSTRTQALSRSSCSTPHDFRSMGLSGVMCVQRLPNWRRASMARRHSPAAQLHAMTNLFFNLSSV